MHVNMNLLFHRDSHAAGLETTCSATAGLTKRKSKTAERHDQEKSIQILSKIWSLWKIKLQFCLDSSFMHVEKS